MYFERRFVMNNYNVLNRFFSKSMLNELIKNGNASCYGEIVKRYELNSDGTNKTIISSIYSILSSKYRNEYFYKNTLLNNLIVKKHKLYTTKVLTELPINKSIADFVTLNGKAVAYEIKTELDNLDRIESQVNDYYKCFPYVTIVTCKQHLMKVKELFTNSGVGIYWFSDRNAIKVEQEPIREISHIDYKSLFKLLRKYEFERILQKYYHTLPQVSQFDYYTECYNWFSTIDLENILKDMLNVLKQRCSIQIENFEHVPMELKMLVYQSNYNNDQYTKLDNFLTSKYQLGGQKPCISRI